MINFNNQKSLSFSQNLKTFSLKSAQSERLLPECAEDTNMFFDDVYNKGTRGKKYQADSVQYGRSMIEMLGVLAIIGVLSVGGIAGYSKAMTKFKINKTIDQVSHIVANTRTLFSPQGSYKGLACGKMHNSSYESKICKKAKIIPDDMWDAGSSGNIVNAFGGDIALISAGGWSHGTETQFILQMTNIPEDACIELLTQDWGAATGSGLIAVGINSGAFNAANNCSGSSDSQWPYACPNGSNVSVPMPIAVAATACSGDSNILTWKYK